MAEKRRLKIRSDRKKRLTNYRLDIKNNRFTHEQLLMGIFLIK